MKTNLQNSPCNQESDKNDTGWIMETIVLITNERDMLKKLVTEYSRKIAQLEVENYKLHKAHKAHKAHGKMES